jgi:hypothetical protein
MGLKQAFPPRVFGGLAGDITGFQKTFPRAKFTFVWGQFLGANRAKFFRVEFAFALAVLGFAIFFCARPGTEFSRRK